MCPSNNPDEKQPKILCIACTSKGGAAILLGFASGTCWNKPTVVAQENSPVEIALRTGAFPVIDRDWRASLTQQQEKYLRDDWLSVPPKFRFRPQTMEPAKQGLGRDSKGRAEVFRCEWRTEMPEGVTSDMVDYSPWAMALLAERRS